MKKFKVGIIGAGDISSQYLKNAKNVYADYYDIVAIGDLVVEKARNRAEEYGVEKYGLPEIVLNDPEIDLIINLTVPIAHEEVTISCLKAGKHVYSEKPLACSREGVENIIKTANECGKRVGVAPDSFLNAPLQTAKKAIEEDWIGKPIGVQAMCAMRGNEFWRPDADFFYKKGAGPMMDMAAYYFNALISLIGPIDSVNCMQKITFPERTIKVAPRRGEKISVEVPTYSATTFTFENGVIGSFINSFDIWSTTTPFIEIYGEKGTMVVPDPNMYDGEVLVKRFRDDEFRPLNQFVEYKNYGRGIGIVDMIRSIELGVPHKASVEMAKHVMDVIFTIDESAMQKRELKVNSTVDKPTGLWLTPEEDYYK